MGKSFTRALRHLKTNHKTTKLDEKKEVLNEIPTMHTGGVYSKNPPGFRYDPPSPAKRFIPDVDGNWPAGIPGTPGASEYIRPQGYWVNDSDWETKFAPNMSNDSILESPTNTDGFIDAQSGTVKTLLPPNSRSFILGPLVDGYNYVHGYDDYTNIGYIQKDTRQFVLLAQIQGHWNTNPITQAGVARTPRLWDGTSGQFTAYNSNFTLAMAQWFKDRITASDFTKNFPYFYSGGVFQPPLDPQPPGSPGGMDGGNAAGTGGDGKDPSDGDGKAAVGSGGTPDIGDETPQGDPEGGDAASQGYPAWGRSGSRNKRGSGARGNRGRKKPKPSTPKPQGGSGGGTGNPTNRRGSGARNRGRGSGSGGSGGSTGAQGGSGGGQGNPTNQRGSGQRNRGSGQGNTGSGSTPKPQGGSGGGTGNPTNQRGSGQRNRGSGSTPKPQGGRGGGQGNPTNQRGSGQRNRGSRSTPSPTPKPTSTPKPNTQKTYERNRANRPDVKGGGGAEELIKTTFATGKDFINNPLKYAVQGLLNLGGKITGQDGLATSFNNLVHHTNNNNRNHPDFRKNDPSSDNYEGPKEVETSDKNRQNIVNKLDTAISNLNGGKGPKNRNGNLTDDEITQVSDEMKRNYYKNQQDQANSTFYNSFHSLPVGGDRGDGKPVTTFTVKDGKFEKLDSNYWFSDPRDANPLASDEAIPSNNFQLPSTIISNTIHGVSQQAIENGKWTKGSSGKPFYSDENKTKVIGTQYNTQQSFSRNSPKGNKKEDYILQNKNNLVESRKRILREITQPLKEIKELPKTQKLEKYRPNFAGKYKPQNTPNVTASKQSDEIVKAKNAAGQTWRTKDKYWGGYESQERMNVVYDNVGHGNEYFNRIVNENLSKKNIKNRQVQEHLNIIAHEKAMRQLDSSFISPFKSIEEQETYDNKVKDPLFSKVSDRLKKEIDYENKPASKGYPNEAPPEMVNGFHPDYGKSYKYDKLDPQSAEAMPVQGNPEIDANVQKALDKRAKNRKIKNLKIDAPTVENFSWKETLKEKKLEESKKGFKKFKQDLKEGMTTGSIMTLSAPPQGDGTVAIDSVDPLDNASYAVVTDLFSVGDNLAANTGTTVRSSGSGSGTDGGFNVGGDYLAFQGVGTNDASNTRWAALSPMDSSAVDTITITAIVGNDTNGGEDPDAAGEGLAVMYKKPGMTQARFLNTDPQGVQRGTATSDIIIPLGSSSNSGLNSYSVEVPEYARAKDTQFVLIQPTNSGSEYDHYGITQIKVQRRAPVNVVVPLSDPAAISFINVGTTEGDPKKRKKKVQDQLDASDEYVTSQFGDDFPTGARLTSDDEIEASPIGKNEVTNRFANLTDKQKVSQSDEFINDYIKTYDNDTYADAESIAILDRAIKLNPKNTDAYLYRSFAHFENQNYEDALKDADSILEVNPDDSDVSFMKAVIYKEKGDLELSLEEIKKSLETYPDDPYLEDMKAEVEDQIVQEYRAKQVPPDANEEGGVVKRQTYYDEISKELAPEEDNTEDQQLVSTNLAQAKDLMSSTNYNTGRDGVFSKGAIELLQNALEVEPNNPEILSNLGVAMMMGGSTSKGLEHLERAQALDPNVEFDFNIKSWDRYDGEEKPAYAGPRIGKLYNLPYRYAREIIKNLPDQSKAKGATYGATGEYAKSYGGSYSKFYTDKAKGKSTEQLQRMLVDAAREIEDNKYWMEDLSRHDTFSGNTDIVGVPGYVLGGTKWTGALNGVTREDYNRENAILDDMINAGSAGWKSQWEKVREISIQLKADSRTKAVSRGVKADVERYQAYYDEYMRRGEPDAIEKVDVPEEGTFVATAQKEIIEKAISEPTKLFKLSAAEEKSYNAALEQTGANSVSYVAALPFALGTSILTGKPQKMWLSPSSAIKIAQDINAQELANVLRINNPVPVTAREAIQPSEGKSDKVITTLFGKQGGLYFNYDTETKQLYIESRKTLRTTSGGETVDKFRGDLVGDILFQLPNATGTGTNFTDIPVPSNEQINEIASKIIYKALNQYNVYQDFVDPVVKSGFNPIKIANVIWDGLRGKIKTKDDFRSDAPRTIWDEKSGKMMNNYDYGVAGLKQVFDQNLISDMTTTAASFTVDAGVNAIAANLIALRSILTDIGVPASDIEKFGGAYGMTYSSTPVNYDDLPDDVKAVIDAATGTGIEEPKPTEEPKPKPEPKDDSDLGSAGGFVGGDATAAATAAAEKDKDKNKNKNESTLYKKVIGKTLLKT